MEKIERAASGPPERDAALSGRRGWREEAARGEEEEASDETPENSGGPDEEGEEQGAVMRDRSGK